MELPPPASSLYPGCPYPAYTHVHRALLKVAIFVHDLSLNPEAMKTLLTIPDQNGVVQLATSQ